MNHVGIVAYFDYVQFYLASIYRPHCEVIFSFKPVHFNRTLFRSLCERNRLRKRIFYDLLRAFHKRSVKKSYISLSQTLLFPSLSHTLLSKYTILVPLHTSSLPLSHSLIHFQSLCFSYTDTFSLFYIPRHALTLSLMHRYSFSLSYT